MNPGSFIDAQIKAQRKFSPSKTKYIATQNNVYQPTKKAKGDQKQIGDSSDSEEANLIMPTETAFNINKVPEAD